MQTISRQTGMVPGNVFPICGWSHGEGRFQGSARNDKGSGEFRQSDVRFMLFLQHALLI